MSAPVSARVITTRTRDTHAHLRREYHRIVITTLVPVFVLFAVPTLVLLVVAVLRHGGAA